MAGCLSGRRFEFLDARWRLCGSWIIWALPVYWSSDRFCHSPSCCTRHYKKMLQRDVRLAGCLHRLLPAPERDTSALLLLWHRAAPAPTGERGGWKGVVGAGWLTESFLTPAVVGGGFFPPPR